MRVVSNVSIWPVLEFKCVICLTRGLGCDETQDLVTWIIITEPESWFSLDKVSLMVIAYGDLMSYLRSPDDAQTGIKTFTQIIQSNLWLYPNK